MNIRRKSTTHDLATLRLHPDGSRVQQSSTNSRHRTAGSTVVDSRGNWIAKDAGGKSSVKTRKGISNLRADDADGGFVDLSEDEDRPRRQSTGKERARDSQTLDEGSHQDLEPGRLDTRTRRRLSFVHDLSFLDPPLTSVSTLERDVDPLDAPFVSFSDPAPDLLKAIHHFTSCYYRERGQLLDSSRDFRGRRKERYQQSKGNVHALAANNLEHIDSETEHTETEDETEEDEDENEVMDIDDGKREGRDTTDTYTKDMYKAFDGSALMAIGIVLQEYVAHTLTSRPRTPEDPRSSKRQRTG